MFFCQVQKFGESYSKYGIEAQGRRSGVEKECEVERVEETEKDSFFGEEED
jgi:hypothetical protein